MFKPLQNTAKSIKSKISASIAKGKKIFQNRIGKTVLSTAKKGIKSVAHKTAPLVKTMKQVSNTIQNKFIKPIQHTATRRTIKSTPTVAKPAHKVMTAVQRTVVKPAHKAITAVQRTIVKPIARVTKAVAKPIARTVARAVPRPVARAVAKVVQIFKPKPSAKRGRKRR